MAQVRQVVSESLQATIRRLLPSQQGFTEDLQASNVITPIIDLTPTAEGSLLDKDLSRALSYDSQTTFDIGITGTATLINTTGFYRVFGVATCRQDASSTSEAKFSMSDGLSTKDIWNMSVSPGGGGINPTALQVDFVVYLNAGESLSATCVTNAHIIGSTRQIADVSGNIVNPAGFISS